MIIGFVLVFFLYFKFELIFLFRSYFFLEF